ncbi:MAG TPA: tetratricopeptide repeat protein, partial [Verrucomicrobiota bacterium]|nr:tetratricopeptide repeat protein [Verrucomicrobiota bacterium]
ITADDGALPPGPPQDLGVRAEIAEATGRAEEALPLVEQALHARPDDPRLQIVKARALASLGRQPEAIEMIAPQLAQPDAALGGAEARRALLGLRSGWFRALGREAEALADALLARGIRLRDPALPPELLDLSAHYNRLPLGGWLSGEDDSLVGVQTLDGVRFDIRGRVQLGGPENLRKVYPTVVTNLPVNRPVRRLHALHATLGTDAPGTKIASLQLHFADGRRHELPIVFGEDVLGLYADSDQGQPARSTVAWRGRDQTGSSIRLFHSAWAIPFPETVVTVLDYVSAETACSPFLIGLTVE